MCCIIQVCAVIQFIKKTKNCKILYFLYFLLDWGPMISFIFLCQLFNGMLHESGNNKLNIHIPLICPVCVKWPLYCAQLNQAQSPDQNPGYPSPYPSSNSVQPPFPSPVLAQPSPCPFFLGWDLAFKVLIFLLTHPTTHMLHCSPLHLAPLTAQPY